MLIDSGTRSAVVSAIAALWWPGDADLVIEVRSGVMPGAIGTPSGSLLARFVIPFAGITVSGDTITIPAGIAGEFLNAGIAGWARFVDNGGVQRMYLPCSILGGSGVFRMNSLSISSGVPISTMTSTIRAGA